MGHCTLRTFWIFCGLTILLFDDYLKKPANGNDLARFACKLELAQVVLCPKSLPSLLGLSTKHSIRFAAIAAHRFVLTSSLTKYPPFCHILHRWLLLVPSSRVYLELIWNPSCCGWSAIEEENIQCEFTSQTNNDSSRAHNGKRIRQTKACARCTQQTWIHMVRMQTKHARARARYVTHTG